MSEAKTEKQLKEEFRQSLVNSKKTAESYVVLSLYKNTELFFDHNLSVDDFNHEEWKFYFAIAKKLIESERKILDDIVVGLCVSENEQLQKMYDSFGGWQTIANGMGFVQEENFEGYLTDIKKFNALIRLHDLGYPIMEKFDAFKVMSAEAIQQSLEGALNTVFADLDEGDKVEDLKDGLWQTIMDAHNGVSRGFPYTSALLNDMVNGQALGNITILGANSGVGKTFFTLTQILPNVIEYEEPVLLMVNEEEKAKWQKELLTWVINNVLKPQDEDGKEVDGECEFQKKRFHQGEFNKEEMTLLKRAHDWLQEKMGDGLIRFVNFSSFSMQKAIKVVKKYSSLYDIKYFVLDTLKLDNDDKAEKVSDQAWLQLQQNMVKLYNVVKASAKNLHVWVTYQLSKASLLHRFLTQNNLGMSKNIVDVASTLILLRKAMDSEKEGGNNELPVKDLKKRPVKMKADKHYMIGFIDKNRQGETHYQLVWETDIGRNIIQDFGTCNVPQEI
jgi:replicative DNA helicase